VMPRGVEVTREPMVMVRWFMRFSCDAARHGARGKSKSARPPENSDFSCDAAGC
jgi:hypothetical protein